MLKDSVDMVEFDVGKVIEPEGREDVIPLSLPAMAKLTTTSVQSIKNDPTASSGKPRRVPTLNAV